MNTLEETVDRLRALRPARIAILTGAGVSAESGIPTFRGAGGLWREYRPEDLATPHAFSRDPKLVWEWYEWRRNLVRAANPNPAHEALASLERHKAISSTIVTQNVDGLHRRAGARRVVELHGNIFRTRCTAEGIIREAEAPFEDVPPRCECGSLLRPDVVWFGEVLSDRALWEASDAVASCELFVIAGTSGVVYPAAGLISVARGLTLEVNPDETPLTRACDVSLRLTASQAVPAIVNAILGARA